jgi:hypothetical protein
MLVVIRQSVSTLQPDQAAQSNFWQIYTPKVPALLNWNHLMTIFQATLDPQQQK